MALFGAGDLRHLVVIVDDQIVPLRVGEGSERIDKGIGLHQA